MPPQYTLDQVNAEIARREAARNGAVPDKGLAPQPTLPARSVGLSPSHSQAGDQDATSQEVPENPRQSLWDSVADTVAGMRRSFGRGAQGAVYKFPLAINSLLGLQAFEPTRKMFIDPLEQRIQAVEAREAQDTAGSGIGEQTLRAAAHGVGSLVTLPADIALGGIAKAGVLAKAAGMAPRVATSIAETFKAIPSFAVGMGIRRTGEQESITGLPEGVAEGLAMHKVGEMGKHFSTIPRAATQIAAQGGLGAAMATADTISHAGRLPTTEELMISAGSNAAMALPFVGSPERMGVKGRLTPEFRMRFENEISGIMENGGLAVLPENALRQFYDTSSKLVEIDPENKTFLRGLLEVDQEMKRRTGVTHEPTFSEGAEPPQGVMSRAEMAGLAMGDLDSQEQLFQVADRYGIKDPQKMGPTDLINAIEKAESGRQVEAARHREAAKAMVSLQAQAEQAREDILAAQDEAGRLDAIKRFEDATRALSRAPALPEGQGFQLVGEPTPRALTPAQRDQMAREVMQPEPEWAIPKPGLEPTPERSWFDRENEEAFGGSIPYQTPERAAVPFMDAGARRYLEDRAQIPESTIRKAAEANADPEATLVAEHAEPGDMATPEAFARVYGIPERPEFLDAIRRYQEIVKETPLRDPWASVSPEESGSARPVSSPWDAFPAREDGSRVVARLGKSAVDEINKMGFSTRESDAVISLRGVDYINARHGGQLSPEDIAYIKKTIEEPTEILPNIGVEGKSYRDRSVLMVRGNGHNYVAIVEMTPWEGDNIVWNFWKMSKKNAETYLAKFREEKARFSQPGGRPVPHIPHDTAGAEVGKPEGLSGSQDERASTENITTLGTDGKGANELPAIAPSRPPLVSPLGQDGQPLFEPIDAQPHAPGGGGLADMAPPAAASVKSRSQLERWGAGKTAADGVKREPSEPPQPIIRGVDGSTRVPGIAPVRVELPEMVRTVQDLLGKNPRVMERLSKAAASGLFRPDPVNPSLELRADIFIGPRLGEVRTKSPSDAESAFIRAVAESTGMDPQDIQVKVERRKGGWWIMRAYKPDQEHAGNILAHEIGHLVDFLPDKTMTRGNILGRLASFKGYMKSMLEGMPDSGALITQAERNALRKQIREGYLNDITMNRADFEGDTELSGTIKAEIDKQYQAAISDEMRRRGLVGRDEVMRELKVLSQWWKPFNEAGDPEYTKYRYSSPELYADAFSVLLNDPAALKVRAPRFYDAFQAWLVQKPEVKATYDGIQDAIHSGQIYKDRVQSLRDGFRQADEARRAMYDEKADYRQWAKRAFVDTYAPVTAILTGNDAEFKIRRAIYSGSEQELYVTEMYNRVTKRLIDAGLTPEDLGEFLFHQRVINERGQMANPYGFNPKASRERLEEMRTDTYTVRQAEALESAAKDFHQIRADLVTDKMTASGMFEPGLMRHIQEASNYATFDVVKYIDDAFGPGIGAKIHKQTGTVEAVGSPYTATISKDISMLSSINWNLAKESVARDLLEHRPDRITPAETRFNGKSMAPLDKTTDKIGTFYFMKDGKVQGYYVDRLVAEAFNRDRPEDLQALGRLLGAMATPFRMVFTTIRPGFQAFNVIRDIRAMYRNLPGAGDEGGIIKAYLRALPEAWAAEFGMTPEIVKEMQRDNMLISVANPMGLSKIDTEHDRLMRMYNMEPGAYQNTVWKPFMQLYGQALKLGGFLERIPKIAAYRYLKENFPELSRDQIGEFVRTKAGSPAFLYKGSLSSVTNNLFLFSNAIVQGMRGDYSAMRENPTGWWWKWVKGTIGPKLIMRAALYGAFGAGVKTIMDGISDYDLSNYDVIPLGLDANGKSVYLRFPVDEMGRMTSSLLWKGMNLVDGQAPTKPADIFDFMAGQAPNVAPWLTVLGGVTSYLSGHNPYDAFHGREVIESTVFKAGGLPSHEQMLKWIWNTSGGGLLHRFDNHEIDGVKTDLQKIVGLPVVNDFLGRFLKVSDYGLREKLRAAGDAEESKRAREVLETRTAMAKLLNGDQLNEKDNVALARDHKYVKQQYGRLLTKQQDNALTSAMQAAGTQREKSAIYQEWDRIRGTRQ